ncbi:hypothetical protein [Jiulongibacter sediminis]|uniref:DUF2892 domain-containing protein n=1 Tax=Jiulongibacter sediminis TaxID=1605367 RepID=A0A0N8H983_9BACT|nr:hypothetical protein [Jiulongibacter sediminis]KPM46652.1 hypothetical protein AFM12_17860 [Jiulongibacter sediminis]TBX21557.1 hypothetical protein TK44_17865 [Jiulongibacter sediminis]
MNYLIESLKQPWSVMRAFRLLFGSYVVVTSIMEQQYLLALIGGFFAYQAITNTGCGACAAPPSSETLDSAEAETSFEFEELKKSN